MSNRYAAITALSIPVVFGLLSVASPTALADTTTFGGYTWEQFGGHFYALMDFGSWADARSEAEAVATSVPRVTESHLVSINDASENDWLTNTFMSGQYFSRNGSDNIVWIGYQFDGQDWVWSNGDPVTYSNHRLGFPDGGTMAYLEGPSQFFPGTWNANPLHNDAFDRQPRGIIEAAVVPLPAAVWIALPLLGGLAFAGMTRSRRGR